MSIVFGGIALIFYGIVIPKVQASNPQFTEIPLTIQGDNSVDLLNYVATLKQNDVFNATTTQELLVAELHNQYRNQNKLPECVSKSFTQNQLTSCLEALNGYKANEEAYVAKNS